MILQNFSPMLSHSSILSFLILRCCRQKFIKANYCLMESVKSADSGILAFLLSSCNLIKSDIISLEFYRRISILTGWMTGLVVLNSYWEGYCLKNSSRSLREPIWYTTIIIKGELSLMKLIDYLAMAYLVIIEVVLWYKWEIVIEILCTRCLTSSVCLSWSGLYTFIVFELPWLFPFTKVWYSVLSMMFLSKQKYIMHEK